MNLSDYTTLVQTEVDDVSSRAKTVIEENLKEVYQEILNYTVKYIVGTTEEDITATVDQRYVTPTNDYLDVLTVLYRPTATDNFSVLDRITEEEYYKKYVNNDPSDPRLFYVNGSNICFDVDCELAGTVKVSGTVVSAELNGASIIPDRFTRVVVLGGVSRFKAYEGLPDAREYDRLYRGSYGAQGRIGGALGDMIAELSVKQPVIRPKLYGI